jgi:hypothetical protein
MRSRTRPLRSDAGVTFVANERGLPDDPHFEAEGVYVAVLREPRARYLSQYLHLKQYGEAYLRVRCGRKLCCRPLPRASRRSADGLTAQGEHPKWPGELRHMGVLPEEGVPPLAVVLAGGAADFLSSLFASDAAPAQPDARSASQGATGAWRPASETASRRARLRAPLRMACQMAAQRLRTCAPPRRTSRRSTLC